MDVALPALGEDDLAMRRVAAGDADALACLFERHKTRLFGFLYRLTGDRSTAEDLVSETFLRIYDARRSFRAGSAFVPWMLTIARRLAIGEMRKQRIRILARERLQREHDPCVSLGGWDPERDDTSRQIRAALLALAEDQRTALVLKEYMELSYREVAQVLGCSEEAARARAYRARAAMRAALKDWWEAE
jgi:RNA polymerase sigma-70 factor (ECF subfamily)